MHPLVTLMALVNSKEEWFVLGHCVIVHFVNILRQREFFHLFNLIYGFKLKVLLDRRKLALDVLRSLACQSFDRIVIIRGDP